MANANHSGPRPRVNNSARTNIHNNATPHVANNSASTTNRNTTRPSTNARGTGTHPNYAMYGVGSTGRHYINRGYGRGYANRYYGNRSYGRSQSNDRSIVSRLRSVHATLARIDHDYRGHRVRAMHSISRAITSLAHRSMSSRSYGMNGQANAMLASNNGGLRTNGNRNQAGLNNNGRGRQPLSQAQSDMRMSQALRTTQGITQQLTHQGQNSTNHLRAHGHLQYAMHEMNVALNVR
jgi:hypothetical protein